MAIRVNPRLIDELEVFGAQDVSKCYHCGNCSAMCPFSQGDTIFPRRAMRQLQLGLEERLQGNLDPWLCYYCGECSEECPRDAEPGETMMSLRRWLTSRYDWTGIARAFYRSWKTELAAIVVTALLTGIAFLVWGFSQGDIGDYDGANAFLPAAKVHIFDWALAGVLLFFLLSNCARMWWFTLGRDERTRFAVGSYLKRLYLLPAHFFTQMRYARCTRKRPWAVHLVLMLSYVTMLVLIMFFLRYMAAGPAVDWRVHVFGLSAAAGLLATTIWALRGRLKKTETQYRHSHETDWMFLILLIVVTSTGVLQFALHRSGFDTAANIAYVVHLMGVVPMLGLEVPFGKWAHLAYRPLAMYFAAVQADAVTARERSRVPAGATQTA